MHTAPAHTALARIESHSWTVVFRARLDGPEIVQIVDNRDDMPVTSPDLDLICAAMDAAIAAYADLA